MQSFMVCYKVSALLTITQIKKEFDQLCQKPSLCSVAITTISLPLKVITILTSIEIASFYFSWFYQPSVIPEHCSLVTSIQFLS